MAPYQTAISVRQDNVENLSQDIINVQILPEEETWAENTTAVTGNTSDRSESVDGVDPWSNDEIIPDAHCTRYMNVITIVVVVASAILSPLIMVALPKLGLVPDGLSVLPIQQRLLYSACNIECKGHLLGLSFKVTLLGIGNWAIFFRERSIHMPRLFMFRTGVLTLTSLCVSSYWLFYIVQLKESAKAAVSGDIADYRSLINYSGSLIDTLLFIHYIAVLLIEIRHLRPVYYLKITRSPDGASQSFAVGQLSIQRAAILVLEKYYTEFSIYNPYLERLPTSKSCKKANSSNFKFYDVDSSIGRSIEQRNQPECETDRSILNTRARRRDSSHNERFYEEHEYERRVKKRRARLISATEDAFAHIQRVNPDSGLISSTGPLDPMEAAQSIFPSMSRALQKYLRITRQQPRHSVEAILERLANCLAQDASAIAFLEPFLNTSPVLSNEKERQRNPQHWALICEGELPSRSVSDGLEFQLRQGEIALFCSIHRLPDLYLTEQIALPKSNRFLLKRNVETAI
ncbi:hypothetical protein QAD02_022184 [Eretmocerus hayati]|uniref:Uncharacterized protein n=1 Tax=Eretmocerus hayati TaxID=131215 RepID=A0ACC2PSL0_9HYME|nr:hypothetical protein QAD02_022184 [Eretmocerus hayati]